MATSVAPTSPTSPRDRSKDLLRLSSSGEVKKEEKKEVQDTTVESTDGGGVYVMRGGAALIVLLFAMYTYWLISAALAGELLLLAVLVLSSFILGFTVLPLILAIVVSSICIRPPWYKPTRKEDGTLNKIDMAVSLMIL